MNGRRAAVFALAILLPPLAMPGTRAPSAAPAGAITTAPRSGDADIPRQLVPAGKAPRLSRDRLVSLLRRHLKYVFVIYQENRSFDSYFGTFPGAEGLFSHPAARTPGFTQPIRGTDGTMDTIRPFRIGPHDFAADTDDVDHSHGGLVAKMHVAGGVAGMDRFALAEETRWTKAGANPSLMARQMGELAMAYMDGDTVPFLWRYANRFVLFDHIFQSMVGPSTPGNLAIISAQSGETQLALHPDEAYSDKGNHGAGVPVMNDRDPRWGWRWGSERDSVTQLPVNPADSTGGKVQINQTYATLPLSLTGKAAREETAGDRDAATDLADVMDDVSFLTANGQAPVAWGWFEEGFDREPTDSTDGPTDAAGLHASYITHHNGPQYFGYIANNPRLAANLHGLGDFFDAVRSASLPAGGGIFFVKGGYENLFGMKPGDPDPAVQQNFVGDDDHPAYSDAQISEAMVARAVNAIASSRYWPESVIIITWDDCEGDYDHLPPPIRSWGPDSSVISDGPRVPFILISPYARAHAICHESGDHGSVVKFADLLFGLTPLAELPDEKKGRDLGRTEFGQEDWGPDDALTAGVSDLAAAFDPARLAGVVPPLPASYAMIPERVVAELPAVSGYGLKDIGIVPVDIARHLANPVPADFNPRPRTNPTRPASGG